MFCKKGVLRNFTKFTGKHLCQSLFFNGLRPGTLVKKRLCYRCFPVNFVKFLRTSFLTEHLWWLLLKKTCTEKALATSWSHTVKPCSRRKTDILEAYPRLSQTSKMEWSPKIVNDLLRKLWIRIWIPGAINLSKRSTMKNAFCFGNSALQVNHFHSNHIRQTTCFFKPLTEKQNQDTYQNFLKLVQ